jgi:hypothetical protein
MENNRWIKIHEKITKWGWYSDANTFRLFIHLLLTANYKESEWFGHKILPGQTVTGLYSLSKTLRISPQSLRTSITKLKSTNEITIKSTNKFSIITIVKWVDYQSDTRKPTNKITTEPTNHQQTTNKPPTTLIEYKNIRKKEDIAETSSAIQKPVNMSLEKLPDLLKDNQKHIQIIGLFARAKKIDFADREQQTSFIRRNLRAAQNLKPYQPARVAEVMKYLIDNADFKWTLETVGKYIDDDLTKLKGVGQTEDDIIKSILNK